MNTRLELYIREIDPPSPMAVHAGKVSIKVDVIDENENSQNSSNVTEEIVKSLKDQGKEVDNPIIRHGSFDTIRVYGNLDNIEKIVVDALGKFETRQMNGKTRVLIRTYTT